LSTNISTDRRAIEFGKRLILAFNTDKPAEIARKLGITYQGAKNYLDGRVPAPDTLVEIARSTGYSIHWLLTGEGPETIKSARTENREEGSLEVSLGNGSSNPRSQAHDPTEKNMTGSEDRERVRDAQMQLVIEQNHLIIQILKDIKEALGKG